MRSIGKLYQFLEDMFGSGRFGLHGYGYTQGMKIAKLIEAEVEKRDELIRDMARELRGLNDGGIATDCMEHEARMRELGIEVNS